MSSTVIDRARPAGHRAPHRGSGFTGTLGLLRLYLRRDRVSLPLWVLLLSVPLATVYIASVETVYPDRSARAAAAAAIMASPAQRALYGPVYNDSLGAVGIWKAGMFHTLIAVAVILTVIRHTRADEESGRAELIDSTVVGRYANLTGALLLSFGASIATGAIGALGLLATDVAPAGSVAFGVALAASGMVFTAVAAVAAQLSPSARFTRAVAFAVLGTAFALRAIGDAGSGTLSWCSPLGWSLQGFVVVNADSRGCGRSDGTGDLLSHQEAEDTYDLVGWLADQAWSDGRVVMLGVSYLAISQYAVAALQPPALRAICPWEGFTDAYRDLAFPGGIRESGFTRLWSRGVRRRTRQTYDMEQMQEAHPLRDDFWRSRVPDLSAIKVPMLVCGSFSDNNLHSRGSIRAFTRSGCGHARLYTHRGGKWETFYSATALSEQLKFLRDALAGSSGSRSVRLEVREDRDTITAVREETQWPLAGTRWRPMYLAGPGLLATEPPPTAGSIRFQTRSRAAAFNWTIPEDIELTGPMAARLWVQLDGCDDANLFVGVEKWRDGQFVAFEGSYGWGRDRVTTGWQRVSLRELDPELSQPWEPVPACARPRPVTAGEVVAVDVALGPSATLFRAGEQLRLVVGGRWLSPRNPLTGQFPAAYPRPPRGRVTLHWGPRYDAHLLIPEVPG